MVCLATTQTLLTVLDQLKKAGCVVCKDQDTATATEPDGKVVYRALNKGNGDWIVRTFNGNVVKWNVPLSFAT